MLQNIRIFAAVIAAGSLLALPVAADAKPGKDKSKSHANAKKCKPSKVGFVISGTLVSAIADDPATPAVNEGSVTLKVTSANSHATNSGELADQDAITEGTQVAGATYTVTAADDAYTLKLNGYEGPDTPSDGDKVHVSGKITRAKNKCVPAGTSLADRYGEPNVRKVTISDRDPDTV